MEGRERWGRGSNNLRQMLYWRGFEGVQETKGREKGEGQQTFYAIIYIPSARHQHHSGSVFLGIHSLFKVLSGYIYGFGNSSSLSY